MQQFKIHNGILQGARQIPTPNFNARPADTEIQLIVIHNISLPPSQFGCGYIEQFFKINWIGQYIRIFKPFKACKSQHIY